MNFSNTSFAELTKLLKLAMPLALYYLTEVAMGLTNILIVGRLGSNELAAVGLAVNLMIEFVLVCFGILSMVSVFSSQSLGKGDNNAVTRIVAQGVWVAALLSVIALIFGFNIPNIFSATGQDAEVTRIAQDYIVWLVWFVPFALGFVVLRNFLVVLNHAHVVLYITVPALVLNGVLNYILVLGWDAIAFEGMDVAGAGLGTTIVNALMFFALLVYVSLSSRCAAYPIVHALRNLDLSICRDIFKFGTPAGATAFLEGGLFAVVGILMGTLGADWLAANEILFHCIAVTFVIAAAVGEAAAVRIAYHVGTGNVSLIQWNAKAAFVLGSIVMLFSA
ncbi:MAG: MATE family efflux transporter, partial [Pseudomonadota bacterium]